MLALRTKGDRQTHGRLAVGAEEDYRAYIGPRADKYLLKFKKFTTKEEDVSSSPGIGRPFFSGFWWMLYRKLYVWALMALAFG